MKKLQLFIFAVLLSSASVIAQSNATKRADKLFAKFEFVDAIAAYNKLVEKGEGNTYVYSRLAEANYNIFSTVEAEKWYAKAIESGNTVPEVLWNYSEMLKANGKYAASNVQMDKFSSMRPSDERAVLYKANPNYLSKILDKGKKFNVQSLDLNTANADFGGTLQDGKLYITSSRNDSRKNYGWNEEPFLDIYEYTAAEDGTYQGETLLGGKINTKYHEGVVSFTPDGKTMFFSRESFFENIYEKDSLSNTKYSVLHLFKANKGSEFSQVEALPINSRNYSIKNPSISQDGSTIYFASDMPGGFGNFDIYKASLDNNGNVGTPINLGQKVNTEGQEMFPYISNTNTLYFSSTGHLGLGGMDVFYTKEIDGKVAPIRNVGIPINSNGDDFAFHINEDSGEGFVSSNREGGAGSDDIYAIKKLQPLCDVLITGTVLDEKTGNPLAGALTSLVDANGNVLASKPANAEGQVEYIIECETDTELQVTMEGYESNKAAIAGSNEEEVAVTVKLQPIEKIVIPQERVVLNPIYFDYDKSNIKSQAAFELDNLVQVMNKYPDLVIQATSHTDFRASNGYNQRLSERRAQTTIQYIISKGIAANRISASGRGETEPAVNCDPCTEDEHQLNRRSQFFIVSGGPQRQ